MRGVIQHPGSELRPDLRQVRTDRDSFQELERKRLSFPVRQAFENPVFESGDSARDAEIGFICSVIASVNRATDRAAFALLPIKALNNLIGSGMSANAV